MLEEAMSIGVILKGALFVFIYMIVARLWDDDRVNLS
jgi:hypothetical protein